MIDPLETASGTAIGLDRAAPPLPPGDPGKTPLRALEDAFARHLANPPCRISFSGGLDSSFVLALAARVARERSLPPPVPVTATFPGVDTAREDEWQQMVLSHVGLVKDWQRLQLHEELDLVDSRCTELLRRSGGMFWPSNLHFFVPLAEVDRGGSLVTGVGGDELFSPSFYTTAVALRERHQLPDSLRKLPAALLPLAPTPVRAAYCYSQLGQLADTFPPYLTRAARLRFRALYAWHEGQQPAGWDRVRRLLWKSRYVQVMLRSSAHIAEMTGVEVAHPFLDPEVVEAFASTYGPEGPGRRGSAMSLLDADLLPPPLLRRDTKASFNGAFWRAGTRAFARSEAVDNLPDSVARLVDRRVLREIWREHDPYPGSHTLLQAAWAHRQGLSA